MSEAHDPFAQSTYQVRFDWGVEGLRRLASADIVVVVDVLGLSTTAVQAIDRGEDVRGDPAAEPISQDPAHFAPASPARIVEAAASDDRVVLLGGIRNAAAVARAALAEQERRGARTSIAVIAVGAAEPSGSGASLRFTVEDLFGAGAVIAALTDLGIDHSSPEAAAAAEAFRPLRRAMRHLLSASGSGRELAGRGVGADEIHAAAELDASTAVPRLRDGAFVAG